MSPCSRTKRGRTLASRVTGVSVLSISSAASALFLVCLLPTVSNAFQSVSFESRVRIFQQHHVSTRFPSKRTTYATKPLFELPQSGVDDAANMESKVDSRKKRLLLGYYLMMLSYLGVGASAFIQSGTIIITPLSCYLSAGPLLVAGMAFILSGAARKNRLASSTYRRLNLLLANYGLIGLVAHPTN